jgi:heme-degrading monooxygenase HmoA
MRFLLFDVLPQPNAMDKYLSIAAALRPKLEESGGCEFIDRFRRVESEDGAAWILSFQYWRDEASLVRWRGDGIHHDAQQSGRDSVFDDYRLRVGEVLRSKAPASGAMQLREPPLGGNFVVIVETMSANFDLSTLAPVLRFESIYRPGRFLHVGNTASYEQALRAFSAVEVDEAVSHAAIGVVDRDYGMYKREQAPQVFPPR